MSVDTARLVSSALPYPWYRDDEEQDEPLAGQDHRFTIDAIYYALNNRLAGERCFVAAELRVHPNPQDLREYKEPDVLVALGVPDRVRERYLISEEGKAPDLVIEVLSPSSVENSDLDEKKKWYAKEGVREYVVVDPSGKFADLGPRLQRFWLAAGDKVPADFADGDGILRSRLIPFGLQVLDEWVRVVDLATGEVLPTPKESEQRRLQAEREVREARASAWEASLLAAQARDQADQAREEAQTERAARQRAEERATQESQARQALEAELERLRRQLEGREATP